MAKDDVGSYEVCVFTNDNAQRAWDECLYWKGTSLIAALRAFRKAKKLRLGAYVSLRWG